MLLTVEDLRRFMTTNESDIQLEVRLQAVETAIRKYTNNDFLEREFKSIADIDNDKIIAKHVEGFKPLDTILLTHSRQDGNVYTIDSIDGNRITLIEHTERYEMDVYITKVVYPKDVILGAVNLIKWDLSIRDKVGIKSESISRHSVTYFDFDANSCLGYPTSLVSFLKPYVKARF